MFTEVFFILLLVDLGLFYQNWTSKGRTDTAGGKNFSKDSEKDNEHSKLTRYKFFRTNYLVVYLMMMMSDWLQGPYVYALYRDYGYSIGDIGLLFIVGFLSSAIFGTVISSFADKYGRKRMALVFCALYTLSCFTKVARNFQILLVGRLLGGISTSLLFSVFEAWMVNQHNTFGFPEPWLSDTFVLATFGNGLVAITSGFLANSLVGFTGSFVSPFMASAVFLCLGGFIIAKTWTENYGDSNASHNIDLSSLKAGFSTCFKDVKILLIGGIIAAFEGSMYTFVFLWGPAIENNFVEKSVVDIPYGIIFATFMTCIMIGSLLFGHICKHFKPEQILTPLLLVSAFALFLPVISDNNLNLTYFSFNLFELCCGFYFPAIGTLRGKYVPESSRTTIMNIFRVPLNIIVVTALVNVENLSNSQIFSMCSLLLFIGAGCSFVLTGRLRK